MLCFAFLSLAPLPLDAHGAEPSGTATERPAGITMAQAIQRTLTSNPRLQALGWELRKAEGRTRQAAARPNPALTFDLENFGDSDVRSEATLSLGQILELGGKRSARIEAALGEQQVVSIDVQAARLDLAGETTARFLEALALERSLELAELAVKAAEEAVSTMSLRVSAGASHPVERRRAEVELASAKLERTVLRSHSEAARARLSSMWGESAPGFQRLLGALTDPPELPLLDSLWTLARTSPVVRRWAAERTAREQRLRLERARSRLDLDLQLGVRRFDETSSHALVAGVSAPLPLFDRNRGAIDEAAASLAQLPYSEAAARVELDLALSESHVALGRARSKLDALRQDVLPGAEQALEQIRVGFERGRFTYLDFLEARRTWLRARNEELQALLEAHLSLARIERTLGVSMDPAANPQEGSEK